MKDAIQNARKAILFIILCLSISLFVKTYFPGTVKSKPSLAQAHHFKNGEEIHCRVEWKRLRMGSLILRFEGIEELGGRRAAVITAHTKVANFRDDETIYADPETYQPIRVERRFSKFGIKTRITEEYDHQNNTLKITEHRLGRKKERVISDKPNMQNSLLLLYKCRTMGEYKIGSVFPVVLPTAEFTMKLSGIKDVKVPLGRYKAYVFESDPKKVALWISVDTRVPLRMNSASVLGYNIMVEKIVAGE